MAISVGTAEERFMDGDNGTTPDALSAFTTVAGSDRMLLLSFLGGGRGTTDRGTTTITATINSTSMTNVQQVWSNESFYQYVAHFQLLEADFPGSDGDYDITFTAGACTAHGSSESLVSCVQLGNAAQATPTGGAINTASTGSSIGTHTADVTTASSSGGEHLIFAAISIDDNGGDPTITYPGSGTVLIDAAGSDYSNMDQAYQGSYFTTTDNSTLKDVDFVLGTNYGATMFSVSIAEVSGGGGGGISIPVVQHHRMQMAA